ncbi:MAG: hypothetical protein IKO99_11245 [Bacteroidales bacterium]|nr:hypothetical protein [Bacteroidales bacterium]MBR6279416.1 hypothetical protein [Bacteroidales bacterium]
MSAGTLIAGAALAKLVYELVCNKDTAAIKSDKIFVDFLVENPQQDYRTLKGMMTRRVKKIIDGKRRFKIGKTGDPEGRLTKYSDYRAMYLLCRSSDAGTIEVLENYLNNKFYAFENCDNQKGGSAGMMTNKHGEYFLYLVTE